MKHHNGQTPLALNILHFFGGDHVRSGQVLEPSWWLDRGTGRRYDDVDRAIFALTKDRANIAHNVMVPVVRVVELSRLLDSPAFCCREPVVRGYEKTRDE